MRIPYALMIAAVALVSCGGGGSSLSSVTAPGSSTAPTFSLPTSNGVWTGSLGPRNATDSGKLNAFAVDPHDSAVMYAGGGIGTVDGVTSDTGVFKTSNGGGTWKAVNAGLGDSTINWLLFDGRGALYAATESGGIYRSTDGASSWQHVSAASGVRQLAVSGDTLYAATTQGVLTSQDGTTWSLAVATNVQANAIAIERGDVYAGLADGSIVRANGSTTSLLYRFASLDAPPVVHAIAIDPGNARAMYASVTGMVGGIYSDALVHSNDGGATWASVPVPAALRGAQAMAFSTGVPHRLYVAGTGLAYTDDAQSFHVADGYGDARTLTVLGGDQLVIASDQGIGLGSYGSTFRSITAGLPVNIVRSVAVRGATMLVTMQDFPPARSTDGGATWQSIATGSAENGNAYINPSSTNICYLLDNNVSVSTDGCLTFSPQAVGTRVASNEPFATDPSSAKTYLVTSNGLYVASDGVHFMPLACTVPHPVDVAVDPHDGKRIYLSSSSGGVAVWRSIDGGATFSRSALFVPPGPSYPNDAPTLAVDPTTGAVIAVTETAVYRSTDGGATFTPLHQLITQTRAQAAMRRNPDSREEASSVAGYNIDEHVKFLSAPQGSMLVLTTSAGINASFDDGATLRPIGADAVSHQFEGFAADGSGHICAGTDGEGVICASLSTLSSY